MPFNSYIWDHMPKYLDYELKMEKYVQSMEIYEALLHEKESIYSRFLPHPADMTIDRVDGGVERNAFDDYLVIIERTRINERISEQADIVSIREQLKNKALTSLERSNNLYDKIYRYKHLDNWRIHKIARYIGYSDSQVYRILDKIKDAIKNVKIGEVEEE